MANPLRHRQERHAREASRWEEHVIPKDCKRLAEVGFPIPDVSRHAAREKSIRHGHPSTPALKVETP